MEHEPDKIEFGASDKRRPLHGRAARGAYRRRLEKGAKVVAGNQSGTFLEPTVLTDAT
jgi:acyl-CoA reductase-like NAD-dependent aldehyde dehydrogenase